MFPFLRPLALGLCAALIPAVSFAQSPEFYKGKTVSIYIGFSPGGTYDLFGRLVARHIGKHIPGNPTIVAQSMPGAGSFTLANWMYRIAPKDGTAMGIVAQTMAIEEMLMMLPPPRLRMLSRHATEQFTTPIRFTSNRARTSERARAEKGWLYFVRCRPALLIRMSMPPNSAIALATAVSTAASSATSQSTAIARCPAAVSFATA